MFALLGHFRCAGKSAFCLHIVMANVWQYCGKFSEILPLLKGLLHSIFGEFKGGVKTTDYRIFSLFLSTIRYFYRLAAKYQSSKIG
jgi:hypothetical protein